MKAKLFKEFSFLLAGIFLTALGLDMFLIPNKIAAGGVSGIATILYYLFNLPVGIVMLVINFPLFLASVKVLGMGFGFRSLFGTVVLSIFVDLMAGRVPIPTTDPLLASLYGGVLVGIGIGLVFRNKSTTGGTDLAAALLNNFTPLTFGQSLMAIDAMVIVAAGVFFNPESALYALITVFVTARLIDLVQEGVGYSVAAFIISEKHPEIAEAILLQLDRGATALRGRGAYTGIDRDIILSVVAKSEITKLKEIVYKVDPRAFVIVTQAHEVLGEGFKKV